MTMTRSLAPSRRARFGAAAVVTSALLVAAPAFAQQPAPSPAASAEAQPRQSAAPEAAAPAAGHGVASDQAHGAAAGGHEAEGAHGESLWGTLARFANFAILAGVIYALARKPLAAHLASRRAQVRKDLVEADEMKKEAAARLAAIEVQLAALPGELDQMRTRGAAELDAERTRMRAAAEAERDRLLDQARREIALQTRAATSQLRAHAAALAVDVAEARLRATLTPAEQVGLVTRYATEMRSVR